MLRESKIVELNKVSLQWTEGKVVGKLDMPANNNSDNKGLKQKGARLRMHRDVILIWLIDGNSFVSGKTCEQKEPVEL